MAHNCLACNLDFETESKLSNHNYDTHVESIQVNFDDGNAGKKQRLSEPEDINEDFPSISLDHHAPDAERIDLQADSSSSFPSISHLEKDTSTLIAMNALSLSKREQKKCLMLADFADLEPINLTSNSGRNYCLLGNATNINNVLRDQPVGNWELPLENSDFKSPPASQSNTLNHIIKTSPFYKHLSDTKYVKLSKSTVCMISKDWLQFPQLRYAIPQLFSGAVIIDEYTALFVNGLEHYGI
ncbi:hypothetical protein INT47_003321 [Mucor saturninus]|uniref:C2H2-type domain-containing protein n=1 Tax=Mucor saturninus TaxID=64648 RepID=A0A8H7V4Z0_9FUNG|nr:hypothetical protein INT47_003321 [Mucor saturninus]